MHHWLDGMTKMMELLRQDGNGEIEIFLYAVKIPSKRYPEMVKGDGWREICLVRNNEIIHNFLYAGGFEEEVRFREATQGRQIIEDDVDRVLIARKALNKITRKNGCQFASTCSHSCDRCEGFQLPPICHAGAER